ncbi:hypothetical protein GCM10027566_24830 [Arachidicoccus ginsenosidivorans]
MYQLKNGSTTNSIWTRSHDFNVDIMEDRELIKYRFVYPANLTLDSAVYKDTVMMRNSLLLDDYNRLHKDLITRINNIYKSGNQLAFFLPIGNSDVGYLSNLSSGNLYSFGKITPDSTNGYLPLIQYAITGADSQYLYSACLLTPYLKQKTEQQISSISAANSLNS